MSYEFTDHTADLAIRIRSRTLAGFFQSALRGLAAASGGAPFGPARRRRIRLSSARADDLLVDFLNEALALSEIHHECYQNIRFQQLSSCGLDGTLEGRKAGPRARQVKGATHHDLRVQKSKKGFEATVVFDV